MKKILLTLVTIFSLGLVLTLVTPVSAVTCPPGTVNAGKKDANSLAECDITISNNEAQQVTSRVESGINLVLSFVGTAGVIVVIVGGFQYITSQGDASKAAKARNVILYGVVGLAIALLAFAIVNLVLQGVFSSEP